MELCTKNIVAAIVSSYPANDSEVLTVEAWKCVSHHEYVRQTMVTKGWANQICFEQQEPENCWFVLLSGTVGEHSQNARCWW